MYNFSRLLQLRLAMTCCAQLFDGECL